MSYEIVYTSVPKGLRTSAGGFCTAAASGGLSAQMIKKLEKLSPYSFYFKLSDSKSDLNPVSYSHTALTIGASTHHVLSKVAFNGADYSGRSNKIAHHFLLESSELLNCGPAYMLSEMNKSGILYSEWKEEPQELPARSLATELNIRVNNKKSKKKKAWAELGDPGWAGALCRAFRENKKTPAYIVFKPGMDILSLYVESLSVLPESERWNVCFSTYFTSLPPGAQYNWRAVISGTKSAEEVMRSPHATVIDLTKPLGNPVEDEYTEAARSGSSVSAGLDTENAGEIQSPTISGSGSPSSPKNNKNSQPSKTDIRDKIQAAKQQMQEPEQEAVEVVPEEESPVTQPGKHLSMFIISSFAVLFVILASFMFFRYENRIANLKSEHEEKLEDQNTRSEKNIEEKESKIQSLADRIKQIVKEMPHDAEVDTEDYLGMLDTLHGIIDDLSKKTDEESRKLQVLEDNIRKLYEDIGIAFELFNKEKVHEQISEKWSELQKEKDQIYRKARRPELMIGDSWFYRERTQTEIEEVKNHSDEDSIWKFNIGNGNRLLPFPQNITEHVVEIREFDPIEGEFAVFITDSNRRVADIYVEIIDTETDNILRVEVEDDNEEIANSLVIEIAEYTEKGKISKIYQCVLRTGDPALIELEYRWDQEKNYRHMKIPEHQFSYALAEENKDGATVLDTLQRLIHLDAPFSFDDRSQNRLIIEKDGTVVAELNVQKIQGPSRRYGEVEKYLSKGKEGIVELRREIENMGPIVLRDLWGQTFVKIYFTLQKHPKIEVENQEVDNDKSDASKSNKGFKEPDKSE